MTNKVFLDKLYSVIKEYIGNRTDVQVLTAIIEDNGNIEIGGYGCFACAIDALEELKKDGEVPHNRGEMLM